MIKSRDISKLVERSVLSTIVPVRQLSSKGILDFLRLYLINIGISPSPKSIKSVLSDLAVRAEEPYKTRLLDIVKSMEPSDSEVK